MTKQDNSFAAGNGSARSKRYGTGQFIKSTIVFANANAESEGNNGQIKILDNEDNDNFNDNQKYKLSCFELSPGTLVLGKDLCYKIIFLDEDGQKKEKPIITNIVTKTINVLALDNSIGDGKSKVGVSIGEVPLGSIITIECSPDKQWKIDRGGVGPNPAIPRNANGFGADKFEKMYVQKDPNGRQYFRDGTLVGSFDGGHTLFSVGTYLKMTVNNVADSQLNKAELTLHCFDTYSSDNSGKIPVSVTIEPPA